MKKAIHKEDDDTNVIKRFILDDSLSVCLVYFGPWQKQFFLLYF